MNPYRRIPADAERWFSREEIERARAYARPLRRAGLVQSLATAGMLAAAAALGAAPRLLGALGVEDWRWATVLVATGLAAAGALAGVPFGLWRVFVHDRAWGFSRQTLGGWGSDQLKSLLVHAAIANLLLLGLWLAIRAISWWWLVGWAGSLAFTALFSFAAPVVLAPLFNTFRPVEDRELADRTAELGRRAGVTIAGVLVVDASRRTSKHNAYFTGLGRTKRVVLWDNLLQDLDRAAVESVLAHELGHWRRRHVLRGMLGTAAASLAAFLLMRWLLESPGALAWAGVRAAGDPGAIPLALLAFVGVELAAAPLQLWASRAWERQADLDALELTGDPETFIRMERELALRNLGELRPSRWAYLGSSHPPAPERIALAEGWRQARLVAP